MPANRSQAPITRCGDHAVHWLDDGRQRLGLVPGFGGGVAAWLLHPQADPRRRHPELPFHLWRPWLGEADPFTLASFPLVPWSNRISGGGFEAQGQFLALKPNRAGEACPIHGEGWLQHWEVTQHEDHALTMRLLSDRFMGSPYQFLATQRYQLQPDGLSQELTVTHLGAQALPYGLGQHPWMLRSPGTHVRAEVSGVWHSHADRLPREHCQHLGPWNLNQGISAHGDLIDHAFTGWRGRAQIEWPDAGWLLSVQALAPEEEACLLVYRPEAGPTFCMEPVTHPVDAVHLPGQPGLRWLGSGESMQLALQWRFFRLPQEAGLRDRRTELALTSPA